MREPSLAPPFHRWKEISPSEPHLNLCTSRRLIRLISARSTVVARPVTQTTHHHSAQ